MPKPVLVACWTPSNWWREWSRLAPPASILKISWLPWKNVATWAARCWSRPRKQCRNWWQPVWQPTSAAPPPWWSPVPTPTRRISWPRMRILTMPTSWPVSAPPKASTRYVPASIRRLPVVWPTPPTPTWCGVKPPSRIWTKHASLPKRSRPSSRIASWPTTAPRASTGRRTWTMPPSPASSRSCPTWVTSTSSSPWQASTTCGSTCMSWPTSTPVAKGWSTMSRWCSSLSLPPPSVATPSWRTSRKWVPVTLTRWPPSSRVANPRWPL